MPPAAAAVAATPTQSRASRGTHRVDYRDTDAATSDDDEQGSDDHDHDFDDDRASTRDEPVEAASLLDWKSLIQIEIDRGAKPNKDEWGTLKRDMESILNGAVEHAHALTDRPSPAMSNFVSSVGVTDGREGFATTTYYHGKISPDSFQHAIEAQRATLVGVAAAIDEYLDTTIRENQECIDRARAELENREKGAIQTKKQVSKIAKRIVAERREISIRHHGEGRRELKNLKRAMRK